MRGLAGIPFTFTDEKGVQRNSLQFNAATWIFNMKNRFRWVDRVDTTTKGEKLESGGIEDPRISTVIKLANALGVRIDELIGKKTERG